MGVLTGTLHGDAANDLLGFYQDKAHELEETGQYFMAAIALAFALETAVLAYLGLARNQVSQNCQGARRILWGIHKRESPDVASQHDSRCAGARCPQAISGDGACSGRAEPTALRGFGSAGLGSWRRQFDVGDFRLGAVHDLSRKVRYSRQSIGSAWADPQGGRWAQAEDNRGSNPRG